MSLHLSHCHHRAIATAMLVLTALAMAVSSPAQRRITPVANTSATKPRPMADIDSASTEPRSVVLIDSINGHVVTDTLLTQAPKLEYPLWESASVGLNVWDPVMRCFGQQYGLIGMWAELSLHNWIKPIVEFGFGKASIPSEINTYTYSSPLAPYLKVGLNYNFLYNSTPDYQTHVGLRYGISHYSFAVGPVSYDQTYWDEQSTFNIGPQAATTGYFEAIAGLKVMIVKGLYLGWDVRIHSIIHGASTPSGNPAYIPGYGMSDGLFSGSISISYTIPFHRPQKQDD